VALLELGGVAFVRANYPAARDACLDGLAIAEKISDLQTLAHLLTGLSLCYRELEQHPLALNHCKRSQEIYEALGDRYGVVQAYLTQGELNRKLRKYEEAQELCQQAVRISQEIGHVSGEADGYYRLGQIALSMGDKARALNHQYLGLTLAAEINEMPLVWDCLYEIAAILAIVDCQSGAVSILTWLQNQPEIGGLRQQNITEILSKLPGIINIASEQAIRIMDQNDMIHLVETYLVQQQIMAKP
jgi:tetratricopeptide (TPR) repeat protein